MRRNPERLAWAILLTSFFICVSLAIGTPMGIRYYILHASVLQSVTLEVQQGPLRAMPGGRGVFVSIPETRDDIRERTIVATDATLGRLVMRDPRPDGPIVATVQLYDNTEVVLSSARSPRYPVSRLPHVVALEVRAGHVRIQTFSDDSRATSATVQTPHGMIALTKGNYEIKVGAAQTEVTVHGGRADISGLNTGLQAEERGIMNSGGVIGPLPATPNLIGNGDFVDPLEGTWNTYNRIDVAGESAGEVQTTHVEGMPAVVITRRDVGPAQTGITQALDADVSGLRSLRLHLLLRVEEQDVPVCGSLGSECPVMVGIHYVDANGADQEWTQGFYWLPDPNGINPEACISCSTHNQHIRVPQGIWYAYLSPNLIPQLSQDGRPPRTLRSITIYASGHTYQAMIAEVELTGQ